MHVYNLRSVKLVFVIDLPEKTPSKRPCLTAAASYANQRPNTISTVFIHQCVHVPLQQPLSLIGVQISTVQEQKCTLKKSAQDKEQYNLS